MCEWVGGSRSRVDIGEGDVFFYHKHKIEASAVHQDQTWTFMNHLLLLCLSIAHSDPAGFGVMPKEPRKTEGRRKYYIRQWLVISGPRLSSYTYEYLVYFKYAPQIFRLARWHPNCHSVPFKINHCHFSQNNNKILCNQNSLGTVQRQGTRLSPAFN